MASGIPARNRRLVVSVVLCLFVLGRRHGLDALLEVEARQALLEAIPLEALAAHATRVELVPDLEGRDVGVRDPQPDLLGGERLVHLDVLAVLVTHDAELAALADSQLVLRDGRPVPQSGAPARIVPVARGETAR